jgi:hypothetical protein
MGDECSCLSVYQRNKNLSYPCRMEIRNYRFTAFTKFTAATATATTTTTSRFLKFFLELSRRLKAEI